MIEYGTFDGSADRGGRSRERFRAGHGARGTRRGRVTVQSIALRIGGRDWCTCSRKTVCGAARWAVEARDDRTLVIRWAEPYFQAARGELAPLPRHLLEQKYENDRVEFAAGEEWTTDEVLAWLAEHGRPMRRDTWYGYVSRGQAPQPRYVGRTPLWPPDVIKEWHATRRRRNPEGA